MDEIKGKTENELKQMLKGKTEALRVFRFALSGGKVKNTKEGLKVKKEIARIKTVLNAIKK